MNELIGFIARAIDKKFTGKIELNFSQGSFRINIFRGNIDPQDLTGIVL